jgi:catechol 2,3-dioxygenase-like lactoylglutathione lyase family enzyme
MDRLKTGLTLRHAPDMLPHTATLERRNAMMMRASVFALLLLVPVHAARAACAVDDITSAGITGFQEAVISVGDLDAANETWQQVGGFEVVCDGPADAALASYWNLPEDTPIHEVVLRKGAADRFVRLVQIYGLEQDQIRSSGMPWDHGGYFDLYVYVDDVDAVFNQLRARGWQGYNDPVHYTLDPFDIDEAIMRGPNGEALCLMQRNAPPYDQAEAGSQSGWGWPFNTALIVADYDANAAFFADLLGWTVHLSGRSTTPAPGFNPTGIPANLASTAARKFAAYAPSETDRNGSIQILMAEGLTGRDFTPRTDPPNLGVLATRVPVDDVDALAAKVAAAGYPIATPVTELTVPPYGPVKMMTLKAPNGARIDFFQQL